MVIVVRSVFHEGNPEVFLDECFHKLRSWNMIGLMFLKELKLLKPVVHVGVLFVITDIFLR